MERDRVVHCGTKLVGTFVHSLVLTDVASGWTECLAIPVREQTLIVEAITGLRRRLPFPPLGLDTDNDSAFMNNTLYEYCQKHGIVFTRSRAYRKNDQAWVEQKNGAIVRKLIGYGRLEGLSETAALRRLRSYCCIDFGLPHISGGSAPALTFSRPARHLLHYGLHARQVA